MTRNQFLNLRIGDTVAITVHGKNKNKRGIVNDIIRGPGQVGIVHLTPASLICPFEFPTRSKRQLENGNWVFKKNEIKLERNVRP